MTRITPALRRQGQRAIKAGFQWVESALRDPEAYPDFVVVLAFDPETLSRIFTQERLRLWAELHRRPPKSLTALAQRMGRDVSRVRHDLRILERAHMARFEHDGRRVRPVAQAPSIVIAPPA